MIPYDRSIDPPAPFVQIRIQHTMSDRQEIVTAQIDTGADISGIPQQIVDVLGLVPVRSLPIEGYDDVCVQLSTYIVASEIAGVRFHPLEVIPLPGENALLGRDVLNQFFARLNGPDLSFDIGAVPPT